MFDWLKRMVNIIQEALVELTVNDLPASEKDTPIDDTFLVLSLNTIKEMPAGERIDLLTEILGIQKRQARKYHGKWFQVILRNKKGQFREHSDHKVVHKMVQESFIKETK